ncbi:DUF3016 domain-containing protein [Marinibaculum pumilum]|uniref:DUF3016 domain-containing protein n=1 Tax=Marinibaculum pumilum TaxID=1766165 RepID=A0ABV7KZJ3_9PROT
MAARTILALLLTLPAAGPAAAAQLQSEAGGGRVDVTYVDPADFTDARLRGGHGPDALAPALDGLRIHLEALGGRFLPPGQVLEVEVLDLDLAGRIEPWHLRAHDVRFMRDITWPRISLRYRLREDGTLLRQAEEEVRDMSYLTGPAWRYRSRPMPFEKFMLDRWFHSRFVEDRPPPA